MFRFANPWLLLLLLIVPALAAWYVVRLRRARPGALQFSSLALTTGTPSSLRVTLRHLPVVLRLLSIALLIVMLARPQTGHAREVVKGEGIDIMLVIDISGSMAAEDFKPDNRLAVAKQVVAEFIQGRAYDRIGMVVFASQSYLQCPLTLDYDVLLRLLDEVQLAPDLGLEDGTAIGMAIANGVSRLEDSTAQSKVIILLTDGINNRGQIDPQTAAGIARTMGVKIYTIGAGTIGEAPMPVQGIFGKQYVNVPVELDEETLTAVAETTGGQYFRATDAEALRQIYRQISQMEQTEVEVNRYVRYTELGAYVGIPALALILVEVLLRNTVFRKLP